MSDRTSRLIVRLIDGVSGPAAVMRASMERLKAAGLGVNTRLAGAQMAVGAAMAANNRKLGALRMQLVDAGAGVWGLHRALSPTIRAAADFETVMEDLGQKAGISGDALKRVGDQVRSIGRQVNQGALDAAKGLDFLVGMGLGGKDDAENVEIAIGMAPSIGKTATAYRAEFEDVARAAHAVFRNLNVPINETQLALDAMARAGKEGGFELKDMAKHFPALAAGAQFLGSKGVAGVADIAAALEVARNGAADAGQAANNLANFFQKFQLKETISNFKKFGVDILKVMADARKAGISPIEGMMATLHAVTKGDADKISQIFGDKQVLEFLRPMWANMDEYRRIRSAALEAQGEVERDFARRMQTFNARSGGLGVSLENLRIAVGRSLTPALDEAIARLRPLVDSLTTWAERNPKVAATLVGVSSGLIAVRIAAIGVAFAGRLAYGGLLSISYGALAAVRGMALLTAAPLLALLKPIALVRVALTGLLVASGVGIMIAGIAAAGLWIYNNWSGIKELLAGIGDGFMNGLAPASAALQPVVDLAKRLWESVSGLLGPIQATNSEWRAWGETIGGTVAAAVNSISSGVAWLVAKLTSAVEKARDLGAAVRSWWSGGGAAAGPSGPSPTPRAAGGNVTRGRAYVVGERRRELFFPGQSGTIHPTTNVGGRGGASVTLNQTFNVSGAQDPQSFVQDVRRIMADEVNEAFRGLQADVGLGFA